jgi:hypothetical protein
MTLKVLDVSYNKLTAESVKSLAALMDKNKTIEFIGLAKNNLTFEDCLPILEKLGRKPFNAEESEEHLKLMKDRDAIIEKNKKVKPGAPKDPVPPVDTIEQN